MKNPFESLFKRENQETLKTEDLPSPIMEELKRHSIVPDDITKITVNNSIQHIDGRQFYKIKLKDGRTVKVDFIGEGYIVEKFAIEDK